MGLLQHRIATKLVYIAVLGLHLISAGAYIAGQCPNINTGQAIFLQDSEDCSIFHFCNWGVPVEFACPNGLRFNPLRKSCDLTKNVNCFETTKLSVCDGCSKAECPIINAENVTFFPHNTDCGKYCMCDWGVAYERPCPPGLHWNTKLNVCDWPANAECSLVSDDSNEDCNTPTADPPTDNTSTEVSSTNNIPTSSTEDTFTDPTSTTIDPPITSSGCNGASCPQINDGNVTFFQHDKNCDQYCVCNWGVAVEMSCPPDLYFNTELNVCDYPENVNCDITTESAVETTTEVPVEQTEVPTTSPADLQSTDVTTENASDSDGCSDAICLVSTPTSLYPHKTNCNKYCVCSFGLTMEMPCPSGFHFNRASNICDYPKDAKCSEDESFKTTETPNEPPSSLDDCSYVDCSLSDYTEFYPHQTDCEKYCICSSGITIEMTCPGSFHYNRNLKICDYPVNAECPIVELTETPTTPENYNGCYYGACSISNGTVFFPHETDCAQYCICAAGITIELACPDGYAFNRDLNICDSSTTANCISDNIDDTTFSPITPPTHLSGCSQVSCPIRNAAVFFPHKNECGKYCICNLGVTVEMPCPSDLHFNVDLDVCDFPENVLCDEDNLGETSSTSTENTPSFEGCSSTVCTQQHSPAFFEHETECGKYCVCNSEVIIAMACPEGLHFNKQLNTCDSASDAGCEDNDESDTATYPTIEFDGCSNAICPNLNADNVTFFPHDFVCDKYCVCNWGHAIEMPCPEGLHFNIKLNVCDFPQSSGCVNDEVSTTEQTGATEDITTEEIEDNTTESEFQSTTLEDEIQSITTEGEIGSSTTEEGDVGEGESITTEGEQEITSTTIENNSNLSTTEPTAPLIGCDSALCPAINDIYVTFLSHKLDCGKYCVCDWGRAIEMLCPPGLHFNTNLNVCDYPINAKCTL